MIIVGNTISGLVVDGHLITNGDGVIWTCELNIFCPFALISLCLHKHMFLSFSLANHAEVSQGLFSTLQL
jgi:hypothetical protein